MFLESKKKKSFTTDFFECLSEVSVSGESRIVCCQSFKKSTCQSLWTMLDQTVYALHIFFLMYCKEENFYLQPPGPQTAPKEPPVGPAIPKGLIWVYWRATKAETIKLPGCHLANTENADKSVLLAFAIIWLSTVRVSILWFVKFVL